MTETLRKPTPNPKSSLTPKTHVTGYESAKIPTTLPRWFFGDFIYFFDPVLFFHNFLFSRLDSWQVKKVYSSKGIILL